MGTDRPNMSAKDLADLEGDVTPQAGAPRHYAGLPETLDLEAIKAECADAAQKNWECIHGDHLVYMHAGKVQALVAEVERLQATQAMALAACAEVEEIRAERDALKADLAEKSERIRLALKEIAVVRIDGNELSNAEWMAARRLTGDDFSMAGKEWAETRSNLEAEKDALKAKLADLADRREEARADSYHDGLKHSEALVVRWLRTFADCDTLAERIEKGEHTR